MNGHWMDLYKSYVFFWTYRKFKMAAISGHSLTWDLMGKCFKNFFSETSKPFQSKHCVDGHGMDLYKSYVFCADRKFKMAAISGHSFNIGPYGKKCVKIFCSCTSKPI